MMSHSQVVKYLTAREVARILEVGLKTIHKYIMSGKLKAHKLGGNGNSKRHWRVREEDLIEFVEGHREVS